MDELRSVDILAMAGSLIVLVLAVAYLIILWWKKR